MDRFEQAFERIRVHGAELGEKIRALIHEGNVRRIVIRDERGNTFMEIPLTVATIGAVAAPVLAAVGAIATLVAKFDIDVERAAAPEAPTGTPGAGPTDSSVGATEEDVNMADTVPQHMDDGGTKVEDIAGTGEHDSQGG
jgi:hypothetical protein